MISKIKNIIIFTVIAASLILIYIYIIKKDPDEGNLVTSPTGTDIVSLDTETLEQNSLIAKDFLSVLLNVKNIKLDDSIFSSQSFMMLHDSSILLSPSSPGDQGRPNPFAPIGFEALTATPTPAPETILEPVSPTTATSENLIE